MPENLSMQQIVRRFSSQPHIKREGHTPLHPCQHSKLTLQITLQYLNKMAKMGGTMQDGEEADVYCRKWAQILRHTSYLGSSMG